MGELTREEILKWRLELTGSAYRDRNYSASNLCDLALKGLEAKNLTEQRDALLDALKSLLEVHMTAIRSGWGYSPDNHPTIINARAAIAAVEGK